VLVAACLILFGLVLVVTSHRRRQLSRRK
jgi:hypothetical protein